MKTDDKLEPWRAVLPLVDAKALVERHLPSQTVGAATAARLEAVVKGLQRGTVGTAREIDVLRADLERQLAAALGPRAGAREPAALLRRLAGEAIRTKAQPRGRIVRGDPQALEARVAEMLRAVHRPGRWIARFDELARRAATGEATHEEFERALRSLTAAYARLLEEAALVGQQQGVAWADVALVCLNLSSRAAGLPAWQRVTGEFKAGYETSRLDLRQVGPAWAALLAVDEPRPPAGPGAAARCRVAQGYALFCRGAGGALLDESVFMLPVNSANPLFDVVAQAGSYRLRCWAVERIEAQGAAAGATTTLVSEAVLPPAVTALEADTPGKAGGCAPGSSCASAPSSSRPLRRRRRRWCTAHSSTARVCSGPRPMRPCRRGRPSRARCSSSLHRQPVRRCRAATAGSTSPTCWCAGLRPGRRATSCRTGRCCWRAWI